jgi:hypothetical protein
MKKFILVFVAFTAFTLNLIAQSDVSPARWKTKEIVIDGNDNDWVQPLNFYDDKSGLKFAICNDNQNLYLCFTPNDELKMRKMISAGWAITLSSKEKKKKFSCDLTFPAVNLMGLGTGAAGSNNEKRAFGNNLITTYRSQITAILTKGFISNQSEVKLNDRDGINIAIGANSIQHLVYEIAIPLRELYLENLIHLDELITLNVKVNALERPNSGSSNNFSSGMGGGRMGGGGGRMGGGRMGGRMGSGMGGEMSRGGVNNSGGYGDRAGLYESASFKQKFSLVSKQ